MKENSDEQLPNIIFLIDIEERRIFTVYREQHMRYATSQRTPKI